MTVYRAPVDDIDFVLRHVVGLGELAEMGDLAHADVDTVSALVGEAARFFEQVIAPVDRAGDEQGARIVDARVVMPEGFVEAYARYVDAGWGSLPFDPDHGGGGFPWVVALAVQEMMTSASMGFSLGPLLTQGSVEMLSAHGSDAQKATYLPRLISGEWAGTMNLSEPQAGSDVGAVRTRAVRQDDGSYRITGQKIWITHGDHDLTDNIVHLVLARTPDAPAGTKGISCFIVPARVVDDDGRLGDRNAVHLVSIEDKVGIHASPTCVLDYDGAVGHLIGDEHAGMRYMFTMMNNARLSVGLQGLALGEVARQQATDYALQRTQGRAVGSSRPPGEPSPIVEHPDVRRMLMTLRAQVEAMRCVMYRNAAAIDRAHHGATESVRADGESVAAMLTPISKGWGTDLGVELTSMALQVHGGMGYVEETGIAQRWRDARIAPIYEGTNGIQAADLVMRKLPMAAGAVVKTELDAMRATVEELSASEALADLAPRLSAAIDDLTRASEWLAGRLAEDPRDALAGSWAYLRCFGVLEGGWELARSALIARRVAARGDLDEAFAAAKEATARFYAEQILCDSASLAAAAMAGASSTFALDADALSAGR